MPAWTRVDLLRTNHGANEVREASRYNRLVTAPEIDAHLAALLRDVLEPLASACGRGTLSSAYRCPAVNAAVGGDRNSAHLVGLAADWIPPDFAKAISWAVAHREVPLERLILEERGATRWLHVQRRPLNALALEPIRLFRSPRIGTYQLQSPTEMLAHATPRTA